VAAAPAAQAVPNFFSGESSVEEQIVILAFLLCFFVGIPAVISLLVRGVMSRATTPAGNFAPVLYSTFWAWLVGLTGFGVLMLLVPGSFFGLKLGMYLLLALGSAVSAAVLAVRAARIAGRRSPD
jgi:hypothetical protein